MPRLALSPTGGYYPPLDCVNYLPLRSSDPGARTPDESRQCPGLRPFAPNLGGALRGLHNVEGKLFGVGGSTLYRIKPDVCIPCGTIPATGRVSMAHNAANELLTVNGSAGYLFNTASLTLSKITDEGYPGASSVAFLDQYFLQVAPNGAFWFWSDLSNGASYNTLDRAEAEADPDRIQTVFVSHREALVFGRDTIEPFINTGAATGTFQRAANTVIECGCAARFSVAGMDNAVFFLDDKRVVRVLRGVTPERISDDAIEKALSQCTSEEIARAYAFTWEDRGHKVYYLTVPGRFTFGFDLLSGKWHRRQSPGMNTWRITALVFWEGQWIGGDAEGKLYSLDWNYHYDGREELARERIFGTLHADQRPVTVNAVELLWRTGGAASELDDWPEQPEGPTISGDPPDGYVGFPYDFDFTTADGTAPRVVTHQSGTLPPGITHDDGNLSGTPTTAGDYDDNTFRVTDALGLWDETTADITIHAPVLPALITEREWYTDTPDDLALAANDIGFDATTDRVRSTSDGHFAAGSDRTDAGADRFTWARFNPATDDWTLNANPSDYPVAGPNDMAWSPDKTYLAIVFNAFPDPRNLIVYKRTGNTLTPIADPASFPANAGNCIAWNRDSTRIAIGLPDTGKMLAVYDFDAATDELSNYREGSGLGFGNQGNRVAFHGTTNEVAVGSPTALVVFDIDPAVAVIDSHVDALTDIPDGVAGVHWTGDTIVTVGDNNGPDFVRFWTWSGSTISVQGNAADQPSGTPADSDMRAGYLVIADGTTAPVLLDCTADPPTGDAITVPAAAGSVNTVAWGNVDE